MRPDIEGPQARSYKKADERGVPSLVWRAGQDRRLAMIRQAAGPRLSPESWVLVDGCGVGLYVRALRQFTPHVVGLDVEPERVVDSRAHSPLVNLAAGENLPYSTHQFDLVLSHEVLEHVRDDRAYMVEMARVLTPGGRGIIFCPNRLYPFETHGHYWRGRYHFGNTPLINYLPDVLRNRLAPHVRAYTAGHLRQLVTGLPVKVVLHTQIYPGYDNLAARRPLLGRTLRQISYTLEHSLLKKFGLSHLFVIEKL
jgi:SAM-dependent methyltransferase